MAVYCDQFRARLQGVRAGRKVVGLMKKSTAFALLGGSAKTVAERLGISHETVHHWPAKLPRTAADKVLAARMRLEWQIQRAQHPDSQPHPLIADAIEP